MKSNPRFSFHHFTPLLALAAALLLVAGCQSFTSPPANGLASVTITNRSLPQITAAIQEVFNTHYFEGGPMTPTTFRFERPGSRMNNLAYGSAMFNEKVTIRVDLQLELLPPDQAVLSCRAAMIEDASDPVFQEKYPVRSLRKWPYEDLLKDIKQQLGE